MPTILLVEDDEMNSDMICRILHWEGYTVITAADGLRACSVAKSERPALIRHGATATACHAVEEGRI